MFNSEPKLGQLSGIIEKVTFYNENNGFCVFKLQVVGNQSKNLVTVVGSSCNLKSGEHAICTGEWVKDRLYGSQFKATDIQLSNPTSKFAIEKYLSSGLIKGIGPQFAKKLVSSFGEEILEIIENTPEKLLTMSGIGTKRYQQIISSWTAQKEIRKIVMFLHSHGLGTARAIRIYKVYKEQAISKIKENPYRLALDIYGIGFKVADKLAISLGIDKNSVIRAAAGIRFILQQSGNSGNCAINLAELLQITQNQLGIATEIIQEAIALEVAAKRLVIESVVNSTSSSDLTATEALVFLMPIYLAENYISSKVFALHRSQAIWHNTINFEQEIHLMEQYAKIKFSNSQLLAIKAAIEYKVVIITGGPGVGKTTVARSILHIISSKTNKIFLGAPTGKAAKRLTETTHMQASTIHRMLAFDSKCNKFKYNENNLLDAKLILIDEMSMVDVLMFANLLKAIPMDCCLILMGDVDQLPSVGGGAVLADLINSDCIKTVKLQEIFRQSVNSKIVINAHRINQGKLPILEYVPNSEQDLTDFYFIKLTDLNDLHNKILQIIDRIKLKFAFNLVKDVQILSPMNKGPAGVIVLNNLLQSKLNFNINNPNLKVSKFGNDFVVGDKIIQNVNNYDKEVFNGDFGIIQSIDQENSTLIINFDARLVQYYFDELDEINLAYATTIHKSQGSEYPVVIIPIFLQHYTLLQRNLIYTAITRGKSLVILVGDLKALAMAIKNVGNTRITKLKQRLIAQFLV